MTLLPLVSLCPSFVHDSMLWMLEKEHARVEINLLSSKPIRFLTIVLVLLLQLGVFDPFNFLEGVPQEGFDTLRYIELKHGR